LRKPSRKKEPNQKTERVKPENDPRLVAAARELRDRWLEKVNAGPSALSSQGKYDVSKALSAPTVEVVATIPAIPEPIAA
jgi:hypothetical protein